MTPPIRGRAGELKVIGALVTALVQGRGGVLVIEGPPGIGKSRLLTEVMALADKAGVRTLFGEAFEYQQTVPHTVSEVVVHADDVGEHVVAVVVGIPPLRGDTAMSHSQVLEWISGSFIQSH